MGRVNVLVVDDDTTVRDSIDRALRVNGFQVTLAGDGREALDRMARSPFDAVILDVLMPGVDGLAVCRSLRGTGNSVPILMLTARDAVPDRVTGLEAGADDYLVKPFAVQELIARLRALTRRAGSDTAAGGVRSYGDLSFDCAARRAVRGGRAIELTGREADLLELLLRDPGRLVTRERAIE